MPRPRLRSRGALPLAGALLLANACAPAATVDPPAVPEVKPTAAVAAEPPPSPPARITAGAMPADTLVYAEVASVQALFAEARAALGESAYAEGRAALAKESGLPEQSIDRLIASVASAHAGGKRAGGDVKVAFSVMLGDAEPFREIIARGLLHDVGAFGPHGRKLKAKDDDKEAILWFEGPKLLLFGDDAMTAAVAAVVEGRAPGLSDAQRAVLPAVASERRVANGFVAPGLLDDGAAKATLVGPLLAALGLVDSGIRGSYRMTLASPALARGRFLPPARALSLARRLPAETAAYVALSTGLPDGRESALKLLAAVAGIAGRDGEREIEDIDRALGIAGLRLADVLGALGDEGVVSVSLRPGVKSKADIEKGSALVLALELADTRPAERLLEIAREKLEPQKKQLKLRREGKGFSLEPTDKSVPFVRAKIAGGRFFLGAGQKDLVDRAALAIEKGKATLGDDGAHARALSVLPASSQFRLWLDLGHAAGLSSALATPQELASLAFWSKMPTGAKRPTSALAFTLTPEDDRVHIEMDDVNGVGVFAALGIYGMRRYLASAKIAEAKNTIGAMSRAAVASWEREQLGPGNTVQHQLCKSAQPVPSTVPHAQNYQPSSQRGMDWDSGDAARGWRCLRFALAEPHYYQYAYSAGGPYKGPARGGPDPGPNGFEVSAEGDLDGNGVTSLFTRIGRLNPTTGNIVLSTEVFVDKEFE